MTIPQHSESDHAEAPWLNTDWRFDGYRVMRCSCAALVIWPDGARSPRVLNEEERRSLPGAWIPESHDWEVVPVEVVEETDRKYVFDGDEADDVWRDRES